MIEILEVGKIRYNSPLIMSYYIYIQLTLRLHLHAHQWLYARCVSFICMLKDTKYYLVVSNQIVIEKEVWRIHIIGIMFNYDSVLTSQKSGQHINALNLLSFNMHWVFAKLFAYENFIWDFFMSFLYHKNKL